jgi:sarcosine oxidase, subunit gamma
VSERTGRDIATPGHYGADSTGLTLSEATVAAAWNVQGDPTQARFASRVQQLFEVSLPLIPNTTSAASPLTALWLGPRSWLLVESPGSPGPSKLAGFEARRDAVNALGGALFDVSAGRVGYRISGAHAAAVLAKSCPLDFDADAFPAGGCAQSVFGRVNALFYRHDAAPAFLMLVARSLARDTWRLLCRSSAQYGYDVLAPGPAADAR